MRKIDLSLRISKKAKIVSERVDVVVGEVYILQFGIISKGVVFYLLQSIESKIYVRQSREIPLLEKSDFLNYGKIFTHM